MIFTSGPVSWVIRNNKIVPLFGTSIDIAVDTSVFYIDRTNGEIGIGTTDPGAKLHVSGGDILLDNNRFIYAKNAAGTAVQIFGIDTNSDITIGRGNLDTINNNDGRVILVTGTGKELRVLNAANSRVNLYVANDTGRTGLGIVTPDGTLHVLTASAGTVTANASADDLTVENSANVGMSFLSPNTSYNTIAFGDPENSAIGQIWYLHSNNSMGFQTNNALAMTIDTNGNVYAAAGTTGMTNGFFYIPSAAGTPSGTPTSITGTVPMYYDTTDTKFYIYSGAWKEHPNIVTKVKASNESVTNNTMQDDNDLTFTIGANEIWAFSSFISVTSTSSTPDFQFQWVEPDGSYDFALQIFVNDNSTDTNRHIDETAAALGVIVNANNSSHLMFEGVIRAGATGGTFKLQWAQLTTNATATTVVAGSYLTAVRLT